jgi:hypothetical protein
MEPYYGQTSMGTVSDYFTIGFAADVTMLINVKFPQTVSEVPQAAQDRPVVVC